MSSPTPGQTTPRGDSGPVTDPPSSKGPRADRRRKDKTSSGTSLRRPSQSGLTFDTVGVSKPRDAPPPRPSSTRTASPDTMSFRPGRVRWSPQRSGRGVPLVSVPARTLCGPSVEGRRPVTPGRTEVSAPGRLLTCVGFTRSPPAQSSRRDTPPWTWSFRAPPTGTDSPGPKPYIVRTPTVDRSGR